MGRFLTLAGPDPETAANLAVITRADLQTFKKTSGATDDNARLDMVVAYVNRGLYEVTRHRFLKATGTNWDLVLDGPPPGRPLVLPHKPINTLVSLERGHYDAGGWTADYTYLATDIVVEKPAARITAVSTQWFPSGARSLRCIYGSGWTTVPDDIHKAALVWAAVEYDRAAGGRHDRLSVAFEGGSDSFTFDTIPLAARRVLRLYMRKDQLVGA